MNKIRQADLGTPASRSADTVKVEIDGLPATVKAGTSILRAARESGVDIPKLCATDSLKPFGSCRMCLVEVACALSKLKDAKAIRPRALRRLKTA